MISRSSSKSVAVLALILMQMLACDEETGNAGLILVCDGKSAHVIYHEAGAPPSVKQAAEEIQRVIRISTGAEMPITNQPATPMICLGDNSASREAGLSVDSLPDDAFVIATKERDLFIVGKDTPADKPTWAGWTSRGTLYGGYDFLERIVGVRWLMPGEWGEEIPRHTTLTVPEMSVKEIPDFAYRALADVQDKRPPQDKRPSETQRWLLRHKITSTVEGRKIQQGHSWDDYVSEETVKAHPEYLAVSAETGKPRPYPQHKAVKFCTSNEALARVFADGVIQRLEKHSWLRCCAISPSDGGAFCECPTCRAQVTTDPHGNPSYTLVILDFYNRVARAVAQKCPDRLLGGLVYYNYMYPPEKPVTMEPNMYLVWAPLNYYGWGLAKPAYRDEFERVLVGWLGVTRNFVYHNYSTWMRCMNGAPLPPGLDILKLELPTLKKHGVWGVDMVGMGAWGYGGPCNYVLAKQMWNADVDVDALFREWLQVAYGPGWKSMHSLYTMLDRRMMERKRNETIKYFGAQYEVNYDVIEKVFLPVFPDMERLYLEALSKAATEAQRRRMEMFGDNLIMLHCNMRKADMLNDAEKSHFYRSDDAYRKFLEDTEFSLALYRNHGKRYTGPIWKGEWRGD